MTCPKCSTRNPDDFMFCLQCGERLTAAPAAPAAAAAASAESPSTIAMLPPDGPSAGNGGYAESVPHARLRVEQGSIDKPVIEISKPEMVIGRRLECDVVILDDNVSRRHAVLTWDASGFAIEDQSSANGTVVNDQALEGKVALSAGDVIRIGDAVLVFEVSSTPSAAAVPPAAPEGVTTFGVAPRLGDSPLPMQSIPGADPLSTSLGEHLLVDEPAAAAPAEATMADLPAPPPPAPPPPAPPPPAPARQPAARAPRAPAAAPAPAASPLDALRQDVAGLRAELGPFVAGLSSFSDRLERLETEFSTASKDVDSLNEAARGESAAPLRELRALLGEVDSSGLQKRLEPVLALLDKLAEQPRDIELLLQFSQQAGTLAEVLKLQGRLMSASGSIQAALDRLSG
ncbi:MAG: FHA domain-containing protein [Chloroflexota bacterium]